MNDDSERFWLLNIQLSFMCVIRLQCNFIYMYKYPFIYFEWISAYRKKGLSFESICKTVYIKNSIYILQILELNINKYLPVPKAISKFRSNRMIFLICMSLSASCPLQDWTLLNVSCTYEVLSRFLKPDNPILPFTVFKPKLWLNRSVR